VQCSAAQRSAVQRSAVQRRPRRSFPQQRNASHFVAVLEGLSQKSIMNFPAPTALNFDLIKNLRIHLSNGGLGGSFHHILGLAHTGSPIGDYVKF
jgi:hypothetical protein